MSVRRFTLKELQYLRDMWLAGLRIDEVTRHFMQTSSYDDIIAIKEYFIYMDKALIQATLNGEGYGDE